MNYEGKRVIVTGGAGFIGINLVWELHNLGAEVTVLDLPSADFSLLPPDIQVIRGDILDRSILGEEWKEADYVFHLAARTDLNGKKIEEYASNFQGTQNLIEALENNKQLRRFVLFSTQLVVGLFNETRFIDWNEPYKTKTVYGRSKILAEKITQEYCSKHGIPYIIIRPTSVYGPFGKEPYREFFLTIKKHQYFHIGKAQNLISMAYVKNVVDQTLLLAARDEANGQIFFSNDFHPYTMREFAEAAAEYFGSQITTIPDIIVYPAAYGMGILKDIFGLRMPLYPFRLRNLKANYCYDIGNSVRLGYFPRYGLLEGIKQTLDWYVQNDRAFQG